MRIPIANGIDVSKHNGNINWKAVRDSGFNHAVIRAGYGNNNTDQKFDTNALAAVNLGLVSGIYWFSYALNPDMARFEGMYAVNHAKKYWESCMIAYDAEYDTRIRAAKVGINLQKEELTKMAYEFLRVVKNNGFMPCLYTNNDYTKNFFDIDYLKKEFPDLYIWYARYGKEDDNIYYLPADMWQYSSHGQVNGVNGSVDMNYIYKEFDSDRKEFISKPNVDIIDRPKNLYILFFQQCYNLDCSDKRIKEDGYDNPETEEARKSVLLRKGSHGNLVVWLQGELKDRGYYNGDLDGSYMDMVFAGVRRYQEDHQLEVDGILGNETIVSLFYN